MVKPFDNRSSDNASAVSLTVLFALAFAIPLVCPVLASAQTTVTPPSRSATASEPSPNLRGATRPSRPSPDRADIDYDRGTIAAQNDQINPTATRPIELEPADRMQPAEPDLRAAADRDAFEQPPAGADPRRFQIEALEPVQDRRTRAFFEADPFAHLGWRLGSFILFQELEAAAAWNSNVFYESDGRSDWLADINSETRLVSDWSNHALELRMLHDRDYHRKFTTENGAGSTYEVRGRLDITSRTTAEALIARQTTQEARNSVESTTAVTSARTNVVTDRVTTAFNHRFNRLSVQLRGGVSETQYDDGISAANGRDVRRRTMAGRAQWEFRPTFSVFGEIATDHRDFDGVASSDNLQRDSRGERIRAGIALGQTGEFLRGEVSVGYGRQRPDERQLKTVEAFLVDANVAWRITPLTALLVAAETSINDTTLQSSSGVVARRIGATVSHQFTNRLTGEAGVSYATQDYVGSDLAEHDVTFRARAAYSFNRHAALFGRFDHIRYRSSEAARDYNASTFMLGVRLRN